jgi:hypothetical protein
MERLGSQKPGDFSVVARHSFRMAENRINEGTVEGLRIALEVDPANTRLTAHLGRCLADYALNKALIPTKPGALEAKLTFSQAVRKCLLPTATKLRSCATK